jgi:hypothetical protein
MYHCLICWYVMMLVDEFWGFKLIYVICARWCDQACALSQFIPSILLERLIDALDVRSITISFSSSVRVTDDVLVVRLIAIFSSNFVRATNDALVVRSIAIVSSSSVRATDGCARS